eukprot:5150320-Pleurochrysis_carterae.AAC.1
MKLLPPDIPVFVSGHARAHRKRSSKLVKKYRDCRGEISVCADDEAQPVSLECRARHATYRRSLHLTS